MKEMPTAILPADSEYVYQPDSDTWIVQKKSGNVVLSKKEASLNILARLEQIRANLLKQAVQKQDVVDFYLLSLIPTNYLSKSAIGPEHLNGLTLYQGVIQALRDEYIRRGMEELKDEAETTKWDKGIPDEEIEDVLKPYYKYHESGWSSRYSNEGEEENYEYYCENCGTGLDESDAINFHESIYCPDCYGKEVSKTVEEDGAYCPVHNKFLMPKWFINDYGEEFGDVPLFNIDEHPAEGPGHEFTEFQKGIEIWREKKENEKKQIPLPLETKLKKPLSKKAVHGGSWWEAPTDFSEYSSSDYYKVFKYAPWADMYGGPAWAEIAKTINEMEHTTDFRKLALLIDHFHDLGHNTGKLLDKFPEWTKWFKNLLDLKASKDSLRQLIPLASPEVRNVVTEYYKVMGQHDWRKPQYPTTDFSGNDLRSILQDKNVPQETLRNAIKFVIDSEGGVNLISFLRHPNFDLANLPDVRKYLESKNLQSWVFTDFNDFLKEKGLLEDAKTKAPSGFIEPEKVSLQVGDRVVLEQNAEVGAGTVEALLNNGFVSVKWDSPTQGETAHTYEPELLTKISFLNKKLSKKHQEEAICPSCGEWKTTDFTPEELREKEWECSECMEKRLINPKELPENRGQKLITKFDPEFEWLLKLVNVIAKAAPEAMAEIKILSKQHPFVTIDDAGDLAAQIWTLATEKYGIPRDWLMKKLPERKANLNKNAWASHGYWVDPSGKVFTVRGAHGGGKTHSDWIRINKNLLIEQYGIFKDLFGPGKQDMYGVECDMLEKGWVKIGDSISDDARWAIKVNNIKRIPSFVEDVLAQFVPAETPLEIGDLNEDLAFIKWPVSNLQKAVNREIMHPTFASLNKKAYEGGWPTEEDSVQWGMAPVNTYSDEPEINHDYPMGIREGDNGEPITICPKCKSDKVEKYEE